MFSNSTALLHGQGVNLISEGNVVGEGCLNSPRTPILPFLLFSFFRFYVPLFTRFTLIISLVFVVTLFTLFTLVSSVVAQSQSQDDATRGCVEVIGHGPVFWSRSRSTFSCTAAGLGARLHWIFGRGTVVSSGMSAWAWSCQDQVARFEGWLHRTPVSRS